MRVDQRGVKGHRKVAVAGSSGYIGRQVVKELLRREIPTIALVRSKDLPTKTLEYLQGAEIVQCNILNPQEVVDTYTLHAPAATVCCLASRSGVKRDVWAVDYQGSLNVLESQESVQRAQKQFVLLSAYCCAKPMLQFQFAKLKLESRLQQSQALNYSIVRPTAFFKSVDGQVESILRGFPAVHFGPGSVLANPIAEEDLANFMIDCIVKPDEIGMTNAIRNVGGPDVPPLSKKTQLQLIFDTFRVPAEKRRILSIPFGVLDGIIATASAVVRICGAAGWERGQEQWEDVGEITKIIQYYASQDMVATGEGEVIGHTTLSDHFAALASRGGRGEEMDKRTTTTGVLELLYRKKYLDGDKPSVFNSEQS
eukprot:gene37481-45517_t